MFFNNKNEKPRFHYESNSHGGFVFSFFEAHWDLAPVSKFNFKANSPSQFFIFYCLRKRFWKSNFTWKVRISEIIGFIYILVIDKVIVFVGLDLRVSVGFECPGGSLRSQGIRTKDLVNIEMSWGFMILVRLQGLFGRECESETLAVWVFEKIWSNTAGVICFYRME